MINEQAEARTIQGDAGRVVVDEAGTEEETTPVPPHLTTIVLEPSTSAPPSNMAEVEHEDSSSSMPTSSSSSVLTHASFHDLSGDGAGAHVWTQRVSASFSAMADQIAAASQAIALIPPLPDTLYNQLAARLERIEAAQRRLEEDLTALREVIKDVKINDEKETVPEVTGTLSSEEVLAKLEEHVKDFKLE